MMPVFEHLGLQLFVKLFGGGGLEGRTSVEEGGLKERP